jgi:CRP-like cAMP-binding protein
MPACSVPAYRIPLRSEPGWQTLGQRPWHQFTSDTCVSVRYAVDSSDLKSSQGDQGDGGIMCSVPNIPTPWFWLGYVVSFHRIDSEDLPPKLNPMPQYADLKSNLLLASLPLEEWNRWAPLLERVDMPLGQVLYESGATLSYVYFPMTSIVSLLYVMENGASAEIAVVGNEGIVGISLFMGGESTPSRAVVQSAGVGCRLKAPLMKSEFDRAGPVLHLLLRYTQALLTQMAQTAVCNRHHSLDQQLCRWLLLSLDRLQGTELIMTQELIANMLGVRREGVTEGALKLQKAGLIKYSRGHVTVLDRKGLEERTCECYSVVKREYDRLLPSVAAT